MVRPRTHGIAKPPGLAFAGTSGGAAFTGTLGLLGDCPERTFMVQGSTNRGGCLWA